MHTMKPQGIYGKGTALGFQRFSLCEYYENHLCLGVVYRGANQ